MDQPIQLALPFTVSKRWRDRAERWVAPGALFDPSRYGVDAVRRRDYAPFVATHHYSGSCTQGAWAYGLYRATARDVGLVGVAVFNRSTSERVLPSHTGFDAAEGTELGRLVLLDDVPYNGESFFLARALRLLRAEAPGLRVVVSFADPMERRDPVSGALCKAAHWASSIRRRTRITPRGRIPAWSTWGVTAAPTATGSSARSATARRGGATPSATRSRSARARGDRGRTRRPGWTRRSRLAS